MALCDVHLSAVPFASNNPKLAAIWISLMICIATIECVLFSVANETENIYAFMAMSVAILGVVSTYIALTRFFLSLLSQIGALSISLIAAVNGFIVFFNALFHTYVEMTVWMSLIGAFDIAIILSSIIYVLVKNAKVRRTLMAGSFDCSHFHNSEIMLFFSQTNDAYTKKLENPQMIKKMFHGHDVSYKLQILMIRFLMSKRIEIEFVYRKSLQLMAVCSSSFIDSLQCYTIGTLAGELLGSKKLGKKMQRQQFLEIFWDCLCAETQFWADALVTYSGDVSRSAATLFARVRNAENYFSQIGTDTILGSKYAMQYLDFLSNISCNYGKLNEIELELLDEDLFGFEEDVDDAANQRFWVSDIATKWPDDVVVNGRTLRISTRVCDDYPVLKPLVRVASLISEEKLEKAASAESYLDCGYHMTVTIIYTVCILDFVLSVSFAVWLLKGYFSIRPKALDFKTIMTDVTTICMAIASTLGTHVQLMVEVYPIEYAGTANALRFINAARNIDVTQSLIGDYLNSSQLSSFLDTMAVWAQRNYSSAQEFLEDPGRIDLTTDISDVVNRLLLTCQMNGVLLASDTIALTKNCESGYLYIGLTYLLLTLIMIGCVFMTYKRLTFLFRQCLNIPKEELAQVYLHYRQMATKYSRSDVVNELSKSVFERHGMSYQQVVASDLVIPTLIMFFALMMFLYLLSVIANQSGVLTLMAVTSTVSFPYCINQINYVLYVVAGFPDSERYSYPMLFTSRNLLKMVSETNESELMDFDFTSIEPTSEQLVYVPGAKDIDWEIHTGYSIPSKVGYWQSVQIVINTGLQAVVLLNNSASFQTITPASMMQINSYVTSYMENITDTFYWVHVENSVKFYVMLITYVLLCCISFIYLLVSIIGIDNFHKFLLRKFAVMPRTYAISNYVYPPVVSYDVISEIPCGLIVTDDREYVTWANECAMNYYDGEVNIGELVPSDHDLERHVGADGQEHAFSVKKELLTASPIRSIKDIQGEWLYIISESTDRKITKQKIRSLVKEVETLKEYMIGNVQARFLSKDSTEMFIKNFAMIEIGVPTTLLEHNEFNELRDAILGIASEAVSLLRAEIFEHSIFLIFCTTNIKSYERQYIRDALLCGQKIYSQLMKGKYHSLRLAICGGKSCYCKVRDKANFYLSLYSRALVKPALVLRHAGPGQMVMEMQFLKQVTEVEFDSLDIKTFQYCGHFIDCTVLPNGIKFADGVVVM